MQKKIGFVTRHVSKFSTIFINICIVWLDVQSCSLNCTLLEILLRKISQSRKVAKMRNIVPRITSLLIIIPRLLSLFKSNQGKLPDWIYKAWIFISIFSEKRIYIIYIYNFYMEEVASYYLVRIFHCSHNIYIYTV